MHIKIVRSKRDNRTRGVRVHFRVPRICLFVDWIGTLPWPRFYRYGRKEHRVYAMRIGQFEFGFFRHTFRLARGFYLDKFEV